MSDPNVDPDLWPLVEAFPPIDLTEQTLQGFREAMADLTVMPEPASHADVRIEEVHVRGGGRAADSVRCLRFTPTQRDAGGALLHVHGGGFVMGSPEMDVARNVELVRATGCEILSVDYRLAPEHPHPAGLEDCHAALVWLGSRTPRVGVIGESAGGGLAGAVALLARDRRSVPLACQVLIYPMCTPPGHSVDAGSADPRTGRYIWSRTSNAFGWSAYLGAAAPDPATLIGLAPDLIGLPPTFLAVGDLDLFVHDNLALVQRLLRAGVAVEAHLYPGAIHGFDRAVDAPVSRRYSRELAAFVQRHLT